MARRGRVALAICSSAFTTLGRAQAAALGHAELPIAVIPHPFGNRTRNEVRQIAMECAQRIAELLTGPSQVER